MIFIKFKSIRRLSEKTLHIANNFFRKRVRYKQYGFNSCFYRLFYINKEN